MSHFLYNRWIILISSFLFLFSLPLYGNDIHLENSFSIHSWESDGDEDGTQITLPIHLYTQYKKLNIGLSTGYAITEADFGEDNDPALDTLLDTKVTLSYEMTDQYAVDFLLGLDFNLPSGKTGLDDDILRLYHDPDITEVAAFGEGFNVNPYLTLAKEIKDITAAIGVAYTFRGIYDFSSSTKEYNPGDILSIAAEVDYDISPKWQLRTNMEFSYFGEDEVKKETLIQEGNYILGSATIHYFRANWDAFFSTTYIFRNNRKFTDLNQSLQAERDNSNGEEIIFDLFYRYFLSDKTTFTTHLNYLVLTENDYEKNSPFYIGKREKKSLALSLFQDLGSDLTTNLTIKGFLMDDEKGHLHPTQSRSYQGLSFMVGFSKTF